jgi:predicted NAD-dependent protein-ADP-ribosyltransferase YbiA (DUF1768 family)
MVDLAKISSDLKFRQLASYKKKFSGPLAFLSNMHLVPVPHGSLVYPSVENFYQASKMPADQREQFTTMNPYQAKRYMRDHGIPSPLGATQKVKHMRYGLGQKFNPKTQAALCLLLVATPDEDLVEENCWHDNFWGVCTCAACHDVGGKNMLGELLLERKTKLILAAFTKELC